MRPHECNSQTDEPEQTGSHFTYRVKEGITKDVKLKMKILRA